VWFTSIAHLLISLSCIHFCSHLHNLLYVAALKWKQYMQPLFQVIRALNPLAMKATHVLELQNYVLLNAWWKEKGSQLHISVDSTTGGVCLRYQFERAWEKGKIIHPPAQSVTCNSFLEKRPHRLWSPHRLLFSGYCGLFSKRVKRAGHESDHSPLSSVEVKTWWN
jgi:hypothetical protein